MLHLQELSLLWGPSLFLKTSFTTGSLQLHSHNPCSTLKGLLTETLQLLLLKDFQVLHMTQPGVSVVYSYSVPRRTWLSHTECRVAATPIYLHSLWWIKKKKITNDLVIQKKGTLFYLLIKPQITALFFWLYLSIDKEYSNLTNKKVCFLSR